MPEALTSDGSAGPFALDQRIDTAGGIVQALLLLLTGDQIAGDRLVEFPLAAMIAAFRPTADFPGVEDAI